jgi:tetraacyldisaccharide 4'-kinase
MIEKSWKKIIRRERFSLLSIPALFLWIVSIVYRIVFSIVRVTSKVKIKLSIPVVSVGNITIGGTGKTPMVAFLARFLIDEGFKVGIVSSGYGRESDESYVLPGYKMMNKNHPEIGDEVKLLAQMLPEAVFSVDKNKSLASKAIDQGDGIDLILIDDGFQHYNLHRDIDLVTYDAGIKKELLKPFPYGVMREPLSALKRADIIVITRSKFAKDLQQLQNKLKKYNPSAKHFNARFTATELIGAEQNLPVKYLEDKSVLLFAGIGNFKSLERQVNALCADLDFAMELDDHQVYDKDILNEIRTKADELDSDLILTTGKDWVKIVNFDFNREFYYLNQTIDLDPGEEKLIEFLEKVLKLTKQAD